MFPRRRTDQVYATLQQVQRRITEQSGSPSAAATPAGMNRGTPGPLPALRPSPQVPGPDAPPPAPLLPPGVAAHQRYNFVLSGTLASLLLLCWLGSLAVAILVTKQVVRSGPTSVTEAPPRPMPDRQPVEAPAGDRYRLVVRSEPRPTPESRQAMLKECDDLNNAMRRSEARGWKPLFSVETGINGALQLVWGAQGVDRRQWEAFFQALSNKYRGAAWVEMR